MGRQTIYQEINVRLNIIEQKFEKIWLFYSIMQKATISQMNEEIQASSTEKSITNFSSIGTSNNSGNNPSKIKKRKNNVSKV